MCKSKIKRLNIQRGRSMKTITVTDDVYDSLNGLNIPFTEASNEDTKVSTKKTKLDYVSEIPVGTLVRVWDDGNEKTSLQYFCRITDRNPKEPYIANLMSPIQQDDDCEGGWENLSIAQGDWVFWQGGECPVPDWMKVEMISVDRFPKPLSSNRPNLFDWKTDENPIIAYRIMEQELPNG